MPVKASVAQLHDKSGAVIGGLETFEDRSSSMAALQEMGEAERDSLLCPLTGVGRRTYSRTILGRKLNDAEGEISRLGVLFVEIDDLRSLISTRGEKVGDILVRLVGRTLKNSMRTCDYLGRWYGDGFVAVLPNTDTPDLGNVADQIRIRVQKSGQTITSGRLNVTVSIGVRACRPTDTVESLIELSESFGLTGVQNYRNRITTL